VQPKERNKARRFLATTTIGQELLIGLDACKKKFDRAKKDKKLIKLITPTGVQRKLSKVIMCAGDRDDWNLTSLGFDVVRYNSESRILSSEHYAELRSLYHDIFVLYDLDKTGKTTSRETCRRYVDVHQIILPHELTTCLDWRGNARNDLTDYLDIYTDNDFFRTLNSATSYRVWSEIVETRKKAATDDMDDDDQDLDDNVIIKKVNYKIDGDALENFIVSEGFGRYKFDDGEKFVKVTDNLVEITDHLAIKRYVKSFFKAKGFKKEIRNLLKSSRDLGETALQDLPLIPLTMENSGRNWQYVHFPNGLVKVDAKGIQQFRTADSPDTLFWKHEIVDGDIKEGRISEINSSRQFRILNKVIRRSGKQTTVPIRYFKIWKHHTSGWRIWINYKEMPPIMQYLINTSRMHWVKEFEAAGQVRHQPTSKLKAIGMNRIDGAGYKYLSRDEVREQELHLINKLLKLGYVLKRFKDPGYAKALFNTDNQIDDVFKSKGGTGKSAFAEIIKRWLVCESESGNNQECTLKPHFFGGVTRLTRVAHISDAHPYMDFKHLYDNVNGTWQVNAKYQNKVSIPFADSPIMMIDSNYAPAEMDDSTMRRFSFSMFSNYYHSSKQWGEWSIGDDLEMRLFTDFTPDDYNNHHNLLLQCMQAYFAIGQIVDCPIDNLYKRSAMTLIGDKAHRFFDEYLMSSNSINPVDLDKYNLDMSNDTDVDTGRDHANRLRWFRGEGNKLNVVIHKEALRLEMERHLGKKVSADELHKKLTKWAENNGIIVNPVGKGLAKNEGDPSIVVGIKMHDGSNPIKSMRVYYLVRKDHWEDGDTAKELPTPPTPPSDLF
jgi:5S rRNA maturation endonuclease (ribonuclease M5)